MRDFAFFLILVTLVPISLRSMHVGVLLWIWTALLAPNEMLFGFMISVPFNKIIAITTIAVVIFAKDGKRFYFDSTLALLLCFAAAGTMSALNSLGDFADNWTLHDKFIKELVLAAIIAATMNTRHRVHVTVLAITIAMGFLIADEGLQSIVTGGGHLILGKSSIGDNNHIAVAVLMTAPLFVYLARYSAERYAKLAFYTMVGLSIVTTIATNSRGGFVGLLILALFSVAASKKKVSAIAIVMACAAVVYFAAPAKYFERVDTINETESDGSFMGRVVAWKISTLMALDNPLFGGGFHAVQQGPIWTRYKGSIDSLGFIETPPASILPKAAHSIYFEVLGDLGFTGFFIFIGIILASFAKVRAIKKLARANPNLKWASDLAEMIGISFVVYCVSGGAVSLGYFEFFYMLVALISVTHNIVLRDLAEINRAASRVELQKRMGIRAEDDSISPERALAIRLLP